MCEFDIAEPASWSGVVDAQDWRIPYIGRLITHDFNKHFSIVTDVDDGKTPVRGGTVRFWQYPVYLYNPEFLAQNPEYDYWLDGSYYLLVEEISKGANQSMISRIAVKYVSGEDGSFSGEEERSPQTPTIGYYIPRLLVEDCKRVLDDCTAECTEQFLFDFSRSVLASEKDSSLDFISIPFGSLRSRMG